MKGKYREPYRIPGGTTDRILTLFEAEGSPRLTVEMVVELGGFKGRDIVMKRMRELTRKTDRTPQKLRVVDYCYEFHGLKSYPRPIYQLGVGRNKPSPGPRMTNAERCRINYRRRVNRCLTSVFSLGTPVTERPLIPESFAKARK